MPFLWGTEKAMEYWKGMVRQDMMMHTHLMEGYAVSALQGQNDGHSMSHRYSYLVFQGALQVAKMKSGSLRSEMAELTRNSLHKSNMCGHDEIGATLAYLLGEITEEPRLSMEWLSDNYLKLTIEHGVEIDMMNYPGGKIVKPKHAIVQHLHEVIDGWKSGQIKWVRLDSEEVERWHDKCTCCEEVGTVEMAETVGTHSHDSQISSYIASTPLTDQ